MSTFKKMKLVCINDKFDDKKNEIDQFDEVHALMKKIVKNTSNKKDSIKKFKKFIKNLETAENDANGIKISGKLISSPSKKQKIEVTPTEKIKWVKF